MLTIGLSPHKKLFLEGDTLQNHIALQQAFQKGSGYGLLSLDVAVDPVTEEETFVYWKDFARLYLSLFAAFLPNLEGRDLRRDPVHLGLHDFLRTIFGIDSVIELLQGKLSSAVMKTITDQQNGLFPMPKEISLKCSCPDWATMCKHVAAVLYGVGARLDAEPELLFKLRRVDHLELINQATVTVPTTRSETAKVLQNQDLSELFGINIKNTAPPPVKAKRTTKPASLEIAKKRKTKTKSKKKIVKKTTRRA